jgi:hypothetical protein
MGRKIYKEGMSYMEYKGLIEKNFKEGVNAVMDHVFVILDRFPATRDCYQHLLMEYYREFFPYYLKDGTPRFASPYAWLTHPDAPQPASIMRCRPLLQDAHLELRGKTYGERLEKYETTRENWYPKDNSQNH